MSTPANDNMAIALRSPRRLSSFVFRPSTVPLLLIALLTIAMGLLAWRVSAGETVPIGTDADRIYLTDGFYDPEQSAEHGIYRWTQPLAQLALPDWGPGNLHVTISGVGVSRGEATLKISGVALDHTGVQPGQPWSVQAWGISAARNPTVTLESPPFNPPGDNRTLGLLVKSLQIYAPDARLRAFVNIALLGLAGALLFLFLQARTANTFIATITGLAVPALLGSFAAYRDPWMDTVAWVAPLAIAILLFLSLRNPAGKSAIRNPQSAILLALTFALFLLYLGYMNAFDSDRMYQVTAGIAEYGRPTRYPGLETWTKYGFGQPLIAVPFYFFGKLGVLLGGAFDPITRLAVSFTNLAVTALTCLLLYRASRRFASPTISVAVAATYLLATPALNYARTFFSEPAGALLLLAALLLIIPLDPAEPLRPGRMLAAGVCLGAMLLFKPAFAVYWPAPALAVLWLAFRPGTKDERRRERATILATSNTQLALPSDGSSAARRPSSFVLGLSSTVLFAVGPIAALIVQAVYNYVRYTPLPDAVFRTGYEREPGFSTPLLEGLNGILFSPGKSIFLYAPVLLLAPLGLWLMFRRTTADGPSANGRLTAILVTAEVVAGILFNSLWWAWTGNFAWGPRLIMPILPLLVWPLAALPGDERRRTKDEGTPPNHQPPRSSFVLRLSPFAFRPSSFVYAAWLILAVLGALVSIPGALVDFQVYFHSYGLVLAGDPGESITIYDPANSPLLVEPGYLLNGLTAAIHRPSLASTGMPPIWDAIVPAALVLLSLACLWYGTQRARSP